MKWIRGLPALLIWCALAAGCANDRPAHDATHENSNWSATAWGDLYEVFAECEPLVAGGVAKSHTHVTVLAGFSALRQGVVSVILRDDGGSDQVFRQPTPLRDGIYSVEVHPAAAGEFALRFAIESEAGVETIDAGRVRVGTTAAPGGPLAAPSDSGTPERRGAVDEELSFLKEQQWQTPFRTEWVREGSVHGTVRGPARLRPAAGAEAILTAALDGVVGPDSRCYVGLEVAKGDVLLRLAARGAPHRTLAEIEAESDVATSRLTRLEELLRIEAVSRAEVESARARVAALEAQLAAARGAGGTETVVRAPFTGEIAAVHVIPGQAVSAGEPLARLVRRERVWLEVALLPAEAARLEDAPAGLMITPPSAQPRIVEGAKLRLVSIAPEVDAATGKVTAIVEVAEPLPMPFGSVVDAAVLLAEERRGIVVPASSLVDDAGQWVVYLHTDGETFARRPVEILVQQADRVLVAGVQAGERLVSVGGPTLRRHSLMSTGPVEGHVH